MKNKGFTMIELLAIITILATILLISFPTLINMTRRDKERQYNDMVNTLCKAGETYIYDNQDEYYELGTTGNKIYIDIEYLINDDLVSKNEINPKTGNNISGNIEYTVESDKSLKCRYTEDIPIPNMLAESKNDGNFLNTNIKSANISKFFIYTNGTTFGNDYNSIDCSYRKDGSVMCYWKEDLEKAGYYEMNITATGEIFAPYNSSYLFASLGFDEMKELNLTGLNTKFVLNMSNMFRGTGNELMESLNLGPRFNTINVTNMERMFMRVGGGSLTSLDLGDKFDTSNVTNMKEMFYFAGHGSMTNLDLGNKFDTSNVTNMKEMFYLTGRQNLTSLNLGDKFDTSKVTDMSRMFAETGLFKMTSLNLGKKFVIPSNSKVNDMFNLCGSRNILTSVIVPTQELKDKILSLTNATVPEFWKANDGAIIQIAGS